MSKKKLKIGIVGSRRRASLADRRLVFSVVEKAIEKNPEKEIVVISGKCYKGADKFAAEAAKFYGVELVEFPVTGSHESRWSYAQEAYYRNGLIAENSDVGFALCAPDRTGGTENTVKHYLRLGKPVFYVKEDGTAEKIVVSPANAE